MWYCTILGGGEEEKKRLWKGQVLGKKELIHFGDGVDQIY